MSVGGGPIYVTGSVDFNRNIDRSTTDEMNNRTDVTIEANGVNAWGWTAGLTLKPVEQLTIGANYRSEMLRFMMFLEHLLQHLLIQHLTQTFLCLQNLQLVSLTR